MGDPPRSPSQTNFYNILGIPKGASLADIGKAYKTLVKKWHPDRNSSNKSEAEAQFKAINEAYRALSTKRREQEEPTTPERSSSRQGGCDESFVSSPSILLRSMSRRSVTPTPSPRSLSRTPSRRCTTPTSLSRNTSGVSTPKTPATPATPTSFRPSLSKITSQSQRGTTPIIFSQSTARRKPPPIERKLECTLEELCHGCVKKIKITRDVLSDSGIVQEEEILKIKVKAGWRKGTKITFEGKGDERPGTLPADIIFSIDEKRHSLFKRDGDDLQLGVEVPLVQALTGCTINVPLLGGEKMTLSFNDIIHPGYEKIIRGQGMTKTKHQDRRGDLRLKFIVVFPTDLTNEQRTAAFNILKDSS